MTSHPRRGSGPVRQHSLQQTPPGRRNHPVRRQKSADEDRGSQMRPTDIARAKRDTEIRSNVERPKIRIAWGDDGRCDNDDRDRAVEIVARHIPSSGKIVRSADNSRQSRVVPKKFTVEKNCNGLMYSRQELAERLRLAWKEREANRSNIDVFLAHETTENANDSSGRRSRSSSVEIISPRRSSSTIVRRDNFDKNSDDSETVKLEKTKNTATTKLRSGENNFVDDGKTTICESLTSGCDAAKNKRAGFKNATNSAFLEIDDRSVESSSTLVAANGDVCRSDNAEIFDREQKPRRWNSAPLQKRANSVGASCRTQVSIVIEAPSMCNSDGTPEVASTSVDVDDGFLTKTAETAGRTIKSATMKRRARSAKKRANSVACKDVDGARGKSETKSSEVVTMVSLVSDADSDSETEDYCPRDDKLINQLRSNLPTTPIIKNSVASCGSSNSVVRRPIKSVSFQQDSFDLYVTEAKRFAEKIRPHSVQVGRVTGSALPTPEESRSWRTEPTTLAVSDNGGDGTRQRHETRDVNETCLTDREKRCLVVPIGDTRSDKKRKVLRTRSIAVPRVDGVDKQPTAMQHRNDEKEAHSRSGIPAAIDNVLSVEKSTSILLQASVTKLVEETVVHLRTGDEPGAEVESVEPAFQTTKEKECWHLYRRMCDKGVCVSFDTVLRGMLTPTEYRLRRKEMI